MTTQTKVHFTGHMFGQDSVYHDCQNVGVFYTASKVYECKERK